MMIDLVEDNSLLATDEGYQLQVRLDWYRSLPLSCVEKVALALDGQPVAAEQIRFGINGHEYKLAELVTLADEVWFVLDSATLSVGQPGVVARGESHTVTVEIAIRAPYIAIGPGKFLVNSNQATTTQVAA